MPAQAREQEWQWDAAPGLSERARLQQRRRAEQLPDQVPDPSQTIGLALSGGGIRSATVSLGALQSLARQRLLQCVDYLSTVSGGGYMGAFFTSLFARGADVTPPMRQPDPYEVLAGSYSKPQRDDDQTRKQGQVEGSELWWLRSSGRYLAPTGAGDFVYAVAMQLRNWLALHLVLGMAILVLAGPLIAGDAVLQGLLAHYLPGLPLPSHAAGAGLAWASLALALAWTLPAGFGFFACEMPPSDARAPGWRGAFWWVRTTVIVFIAVAVVFALIAWGLFAWGAEVGHAKVFGALSAGLAALLVVALVLLGIAATAVDLGHYVPGVKDEHESPRGMMQTTRVVLTKWLGASLKAVLTVAAAAAVVALSHYVVADWNKLVVAIVGAGSVGGAIVLAIRQVAGFVEKLSKLSFLRFIPLNAIVLVAGLLLISLVAVAWFCVTWLVVAAISKDYLVNPTHRIAPVAFVSVLMLFIGLAVAKSFQFLNMSTLQSLYASRLTRAYLGASNPHRTIEPDARWTRISDLHPADDLTLERYFDPANAAPVHLVNVTLNETVSPTDPLVQRDRHGRPMTLTPEHYCIDGRFVARADLPHTAATVPRRERTETLSLGQWISVSGAAFSTGVGRQTSLGKSLSLGLANVRLGHWWGAGTLARRPDKAGLDRLLRGLARAFETQAYLFAELLARFSGRYARYWYLSDGGHFENTALYELLRRKVGLVIALDNGADAEYASDDLANAMRLARIDFGCEFFEFAPRMLRPFPLLAQLADRLITADTPGRGQGGDSGCMRLLWAYRQDKAGAARGDFIADGTAILLFKPRLVRALPIDVRQYASAHAAFPQESTADQFFTEEQWESYRKLGQTIADSLRSIPGLPAAAAADAQAVLARVRHALGDIALTLMRDPRAELRDTPALRQAMDAAAAALR